MRDLKLKQESLVFIVAVSFTFSILKKYNFTVVLFPSFTWLYVSGQIFLPSSKIITQYLYFTLSKMFVYGLHLCLNENSWFIRKWIINAKPGIFLQRIYEPATSTFWQKSGRQSQLLTDSKWSSSTGHVFNIRLKKKILFYLNEMFLSRKN